MVVSSCELDREAFQRSNEESLLAVVDEQGVVGGDDIPTEAAVFSGSGFPSQDVQ